MLKLLSHLPHLVPSQSHRRALRAAEKVHKVLPLLVIWFMSTSLKESAVYQKPHHPIRPGKSSSHPFGWAARLEGTKLEDRVRSGELAPGRVIQVTFQFGTDHSAWRTTYGHLLAGLHHVTQIC